MAAPRIRSITCAVSRNARRAAYRRHQHLSEAVDARSRFAQCGPALNR
jgi:hypothetical protein